MVTSFSGGRSRSTRKEPPTMDEQLANFITCGCESSASRFEMLTVDKDPEICYIKNIHYDKDEDFISLMKLKIENKKCQS